MAELQLKVVKFYQFVIIAPGCLSIFNPGPSYDQPIRRHLQVINKLMGFTGKVSLNYN